MENRDQNNELPDTQIGLSQEIYSEDSQSIYTEDQYLKVWAKLTYCPKKLDFELRQNNSWFGRDTPLNRQNTDVWIFDNQNCVSKYLERISKCHFKIEREAENDSKSENLNPAIITCLGRNGMYINDEKLTMGDRRILAQNDVIKLTKQVKLFEFQYINIPLDFLSLPKECVRNYYIGKVIGSGGCGIVRLCVNVRTFQKFAMKVIEKAKTKLSARDAVTHNGKIMNEVNIMKKLSHPHVLNLVDSYESPENVVIIMEYLEGKDMLHRITQYDPNRKRLTEMDAKFFFLQACRGLKYLHDSFITHRDIKPDNILLQSLSPDAVLKISDFGLSKLIAADSMKTICGTLLYVAPEIYTGVYTSKVDIWSLGCVLFAMLSGSVPFCEAYGPPDVTTQIKQAKFKFRSRAWDNVSVTAKDLIRKMLKKDPEERPTVDDILEHPWLRCQKTLDRVNRLYHLNDTLMDLSNETELELTLVNVTLDESDRTVMQPPPKRRRLQ